MPSPKKTNRSRNKLGKKDIDEPDRHQLTSFHDEDDSDQYSEDEYISDVYDGLCEKRCILPDDMFNKNGQIVEYKYVSMTEKDKKLYLFPNSVLIDGAPNPSRSVFNERLSERLIRNSENVVEKKHSEIPNRICENCERDTLVEDQQKGEIICESCGMIVDHILDQSPEWRGYQDDGKGDPMIRCVYKNALNNNYRENRINKENEFIQEICEKENIVKIIADDAKFLFQKIFSCKSKNDVTKHIIIRGNNRISIIANCVFYACKRQKQPRPFKKIAKMFGIDVNRMTKGKKQFFKLIRLSDCPGILDDIYSSSAEDHVMFVAKKMRLTEKQMDMVKKIIKNCIKLKIVSDHTPVSIASGSLMLLIFLDKRVDMDKKYLAKILETSEVTITKVFNKLKRYRKVIVNDELTNYIMEIHKIRE